MASPPRTTDRQSRFRSDDELTRLMETLPASLVRVDRDWTIAYVNANAERIYGRTREQLVGLDVWDAFPEARGTVIEDSYRAAMETGEPGTLEVYFEPLDVHFDVRIWPDSGGLTLFFHDVNDRVRAQQALDAALRAKDTTARRLADLNAIALELTAAETVDDLEAIVVGRGLSVLGSDGGAVITRDETGGWRMTISAAMGAVAQAEYGVVPFDSPLPGPWSARTGQVLLLPDRAAGVAFHPQMARGYENTGRSGWAFLPLVVRDRRLGALAVSWTDEHVVGGEELELLEGFAAQCAQTLDRIRGREAQQAMAARAVAMSETLQRSLLSAPAQPDGLAVAVRYRPAVSEAQVGGDWYDSFLTSAGVLSLVVGDITGHDQQAAAVMGQARNLLRGVAYTLAQPPAAVLSALDRALRDLEVHTYATVVLATVEQTPGQAAGGAQTLRWSNAGHPPPVLLRADGTTTLLETAPNRLLGVDAEVRRDDHEVVLGPGDVVLLYSDGLVERRGADLDDGLRWLTSTLAGLVGQDHEQICDSLLDLVEGETEDDVVLLALTVGERPAGDGGDRTTAEVWTRQLPAGTPAPDATIGDWHPRSAADVSAARRELRARLSGAGRPATATQDDVDRLLLAFEELASNGFRHGGPPVGARVLATATGWLIDVTDSGVDAPPAPAVDRDPAHGGLGLYLIARLAAEHGWFVAEGRKHVWAHIRWAVP